MREVSIDQDFAAEKNKKTIHKPGPGSCEPLASTALVRKHHISELLQSLLFLSSPGTTCKAGDAKLF